MDDTAASSASQFFTTRIDVGGHQLAITRAGSGKPAVVLDSGLGDGGDIWQTVQQAIAQWTMVYSYDRAGLGQSDPGSRPRTCQTIVDELHTLLMRAQVAAPYVLVGHSLGGLNARLYASQYPGEVAGAVLVDSAVTNFTMVEMLPPEDANEAEALGKVRHILHEERYNNDEGIDMETSEEQIRTITSLGDLPLIVITHASEGWIQQVLDLLPGNPRELVAQMDQIWQERQRALLRLSTRSILLTAEHSGHYVHTGEPELVIQAIRSLLQKTL